MANIYQHRSLRPTVAPPDSYNPTRIQDTLDLVKQEFDSLTNELAISRAQRDKYEATINAQVDELNAIRQALYELDQKHGKLRQQYEGDLRTLRTELFASRQSARAQPSIFAPAETYRDREDRPVGQRDRERGAPDRERDPSREHRDRDQRDRELDRERYHDVPRDTKRTKEPSLVPLMGPGSTPALPPPPPPPAAARMTPTPRPPRPAPVNDFLAGTPDPAVVPPQWKKEGSDWFVLYNPAIPRVLDVSLLHTFPHETVVCCVQFSADGKWLATGCNRTAQIFDVQTGNKTCVLVDDSTGKTGDLYIRSVRFSPDGKYLATGAEDKRIRVSERLCLNIPAPIQFLQIWDIAKRSIRMVFDGHQQEIYSLDFSFDGRLIVSGSGDRTVRIWDMDDRSMRVLSASPDSDPSSTSPTSLDAGVTSVAISPDGALVAAGCVDHVVRIWSVATGVLFEQLRGHTDSVYSVAFTRDGNGIVSGSLDNTLKHWDLRGGKSRKEGGKPSVCTTDFLGHKDYVLSVAVANNSQWVVSGSKDRGIQFWDSNGAVQCMLQGHKNSVISISLDPVGNLLASGSGDNIARIWSYTTVA
ncbi:chromatin associated protein [Mycena pura]|uniref:Chromatin associated protein n=1 Tax=Mycena pura TaxID=153505 RepID=A0AAD7E710_9AGAR|nr:chromatin associated protein [Mycena pura]